MPRRRPNELGELRRTAVVTTFGPGAIVDFRAGDAPVSAVVAGLEEWDRRAGPAGLANPQTVFEPRLQKELDVAGFRLPPVYPDDTDENLRKSLIAVRFPDWLQCPECHTLKPSGRWPRDPGRASRKCGVCTAHSPGGRPVYAVPVRFICACEKGHLQDFPWHYWVNHRDDCDKKGDHNAALRLRSGGAGLAGLILSCPSCKARRSMDGVFSEKTLQAISCRGQRPWLASRNQVCDKGLRTLQRGASNLYFPVIRSALSIPPWSESIQQTLGQFWHPITQMPEDADRAQFLSSIYPSLGLKMSVEDLISQVEDRLSLLERAGDNLREDEYLHFTSGNRTSTEDGNEFEIRPERVPDGLTPHLAHLVRVVRLREVRAISGFTRIHPPAGGEREDGAAVAEIQVGRLPWLPAVEVRGEGIFLGLSQKKLLGWEERPEVQRRAEDVQRRYRGLWKERHGQDGDPPRSVTPRFLLVHTLAHLLIKELALECGYSSASLRERLYVDGDRDMAGVLIYTASPDADGTLGGLVRQGVPARLQSLLLQALRNSRWCSSDPLCIAGLTAASEALNMAACHSCVLVSETSCEEYNRFLDRALLVDDHFGFFAGFS